MPFLRDPTFASYPVAPASLIGTTEVSELRCGLKGQIGAALRKADQIAMHFDTHLMYSGFCRGSGAALFRLRGRQSQRHYLAERPRWRRQRQALELDLALHPAKFLMLVDSRHRLFPMIAEEAMEVNAVAGVLRPHWLL
jgi:hypothetical protein